MRKRFGKRFNGRFRSVVSRIAWWVRDPLFGASVDDDGAVCVEKGKMAGIGERMRGEVRSRTGSGLFGNMIRS